MNIKSAKQVMMENNRHLYSEKDIEDEKERAELRLKELARLMFKRGSQDNFTKRP